jgi:hypothetical protein
MKFLFVTVAHKYLSFATFSEAVLAVCYDSAQHCGDETSTYTYFSLFPSRPTNVLASIRASVLFMVFTRSIRKVTSGELLTKQAMRK